MVDHQGAHPERGWRNWPGVWQLREGPRLIGLLIVTVLVLCAAILAFRHDRIVLTFTQGRILVEWLALVSMIVAAFLAIRLGRRRPVAVQDGKSQWTLMRERFVRSPQAQLGLFLVVCLALTALLAPYLATVDPDAFEDAARDRLKGAFVDRFILGSDQYGRDLFSRIVFGSRISLLIGFVAVGLSSTLGMTFGLISGYFGGAADSIIMRAVDVLLSIPRLVLLLVVVALFKDAPLFKGSNVIFLIVGILGATGWMGTARLVRGEVLSLKERDFVQAGRALGFGRRRLILKHIAPSCLSPVIVSATLGLGGTILVEAGLSFLGLGVPPPTASWGMMVAGGQSFLEEAWWYSTFPGVAIVLAVTAFNLLGDGLRDALDPRTVTMRKLKQDVAEAIAADASQSKGSSGSDSGGVSLATGDSQ